MGGGTFLVLDTAWALCNARLGYQGNKSPELERLVWRHFRGAVFGQVGRLALAAAGVGASLGGLFGLGARAAGRTRRAATLLVVPEVLAVEALVLAADVAHHPHLYAATLHGRTDGLDATLSRVARLRPLPLRVGAGLRVLTGVLPLLRPLLHSRTRRRRGVAVLAVGVVPLLLRRALARHAVASPPRARRGPNLLVLATDSLRADALEEPDAARVAPHLRRLAREGTRFTHAVVALPRTLPSWTTLLTSQPAAVHGLRHSLPSGAERLRPRTTLPGVLAARGYHTAVVSDYAGDHFTRIPYGFQVVDAPDFTLPDLLRQRMLVAHVPLLPWTALLPRRFPERRQMPELTDPMPLLRDALRALDTAQEHARFALVVFASTTHFPYAAPAPYALHGVERGYRGKWLFGPAQSLEVSPAEPATTPADVAALRAGYRDAVAAFDAMAGRLLTELERRGLAGSTAVVLLSDHGEHLAEEGLGLGHGDHLWGRSVLEVPLVVRLPGKVAPGRAVAQRVRALDVAPTLLELLGVEAPASFQGRSLVPLLAPAGPSPLPDAPALVETDVWITERDGGRYQQLRLPYPWVFETATVELPRGDFVLKPEWEGPVEEAKHRGLYLGRWKLLELPTPRGLRVELYDVEADPEERRDVAAEHPGVVAHLRAVHAAERARRPPPQGAARRESAPLPAPAHGGRSYRQERTSPEVAPMVLELTQQQARLLGDILAAHLREKYAELDHTDTREFREDLREEVRQLEHVQQRLESALEGGEAYA